jgi:hypothetical protein
MDPNSEESKAKCAQFKAENDQWEREWQGIDPEMEKLREEYSKENMPSQTVRARDDMATEVGDKFDSGVFCSARTAFTVLGTFEKELHAGTDPGRSKPANLTASHHAGNEPGNIYVKEKDGDRLYWPHSSSSYARHDSTGDEYGYKVSTEARHSSKSTGRHSSHKRCASCEATADWENEVPVDTSIDYDSAGDDPGGKLTDEAVHSVNAANGFLPYKRSISCQCTVGSVDENIVQTSAAKSDNTIEQASKCTSAGSTNLIDSFSPLCPANKISSDDPSDRESYINSHLGDCEALQHLIPFFQQKVREHPDSYTTNDLYGELNGLILETYSNWVEGLRSSFADAQSSDFVNDQAACAHLGSWQKKFNRADCDQCHLCKPLYVLTCPGCGLKACIRCKFTDAY